MINLPVFKNSFVYDLKNKINENMDFYTNLSEPISYDNNNILLSDIKIKEALPVLEPFVDKDIENAVKIYEYLPLNNTQAADKRLWTYLTHVTFKDYTSQRWKGEAIEERWFLTGNSSRALRRNAISRLWWATHLTIAPWEKDNYFLMLQNDDKYVYTKALKNEDIMQGLLERKIGWSKKLLIGILEYMRKNAQTAYKRDFFRPFIREVMLELGYRKIMMLNFEELIAEINSIASDIKPISDERP